MSTTAPEFDRLVTYVEDELGFATSYYNDSYLDRRISARMRRTDTESYAAYRSLLVDDDAEQAALLDFLSVNVTSFFRNPEVWDRLRPIVRSLTEERRRVRLWSAPCSDGREPYSLAMLALDDAQANASGVSVLGTDIDRAALSTARRGEYTTTRTTNIDEELAPVGDVDRYIQRDGDEFSVRRRVSRMVDFERHDLIRGASKSRFDLVCCRNLFIYIAAEYKRPIVETLRDSIRPGGYLVTGKTETLPPGFDDAFDVVDRTNRIYRRR